MSKLRKLEKEMFFFPNGFDMLAVKFQVAHSMNQWIFQQVTLCLIVLMHHMINTKIIKMKIESLNSITVLRSTTKQSIV